MLDRYLHPLLKPPLKIIARIISRAGVSADQVTVSGFVVGLLAVPLIILNMYVLALLCIVVNRIADGIDGELARLGKPSDAGGFLDITLDFIFYQAIVFAFGLANPANAPWALLLMLSFVGTGVSFLAFAVMAERHRIASVDYPNKSLHYLNGLAEGTETIAVFVAFCVWPQYFPWIAGIFAAICFVTAASRIRFAYITL
ncbi:MAG: CDP-alcohol phosphatidyltransferase family protein, partial [Gammaproteobacteria bacterium]|nr:CDP-alcohol phosphatidyltransferase family protein [Gammaproteobacteria bacterium]